MLQYVPSSSSRSQAAPLTASCRSPSWGGQPNTVQGQGSCSLRPPDAQKEPLRGIQHGRRRRTRQSLAPHAARATGAHLPLAKLPPDGCALQEAHQLQDGIGDGAHRKAGDSSLQRRAQLRGRPLAPAHLEHVPPRRGPVEDQVDPEELPGPEGTRARWQQKGDGAPWGARRHPGGPPSSARWPGIGPVAARARRTRASARARAGRGPAILGAGRRCNAHTSPAAQTDR